MKCYVVEIRRLGCGWGTLPFGKLKGAWYNHCHWKFATVEEAATAMADMWYDLQADDVREAIAITCPDMPEYEERKVDEAYKETVRNIASTRMYGYDDGECRIVEAEWSIDNN